MDRPTPKAELVIRIDPSRANLTIFALSQEAEGWIQREAPGYGRLFAPREGTAAHYLYVDIDIWDIDEVATYLRNYNA